MDKHKLFMVILGTLLFLTVIALAALNELRLDVYISLFTISYFVTSIIFRPRRRFMDVVGLSLLSVFFIIVSLRVAEILLR